MSTQERWVAIGAVGGLMAGIADIAPYLVRTVRTLWAWLPPISLDIWHLISAIGLIMGVVGALVAIGLAWRARRRGRAGDYDALSGSTATTGKRPLRIALLVLMLTGAAGMSFMLTGGFRSVARTVEETTHGNPPAIVARDTSGDSLAAVCSDARSKYRTRSRRPSLAGPEGTWTGMTTWLDDEQQWSLAPDGGVRLTGGHPGTWSVEGGELIFTFERTLFKARIYGELMCGVRIHPDRDPTKPEGNFQLVFLAPPEPEPENGSTL
jgi:hypothetical protein